MFLGKSKIQNVENRKKNFFSGYFISEIPYFSYIRFFRKCSMFRWSIPLNFLNFFQYIYRLNINTKKTLCQSEIMHVYAGYDCLHRQNIMIKHETIRITINQKGFVAIAEAATGGAP